MDVNNGAKDILCIFYREDQADSTIPHWDSEPAAVVETQTVETQTVETQTVETVMNTSYLRQPNERGEV